MEHVLTVTLALPLPEAEKTVRARLTQEQFGIVSEIDIQAKLREKLGIDHPPHKILGACNPRLAYQALQDNSDVALALPCNVVLREEAGQTVVSARLPTIVLRPFPGKNVAKSARTAEEALQRIFKALSDSSHS